MRPRPMLLAAASSLLVTLAAPARGADDTPLPIKRVILYKHIDEITDDDVRLTTETGESMTIANDVVFVLIGSDADLTLLKKLGVRTEPGKLTEVPVYDPETFETNVPGIYVAGHFTHARHIKAAIEVPRKIVPLLARKLAAPVGHP